MSHVVFFSGSIVDYRKALQRRRSTLSTVVDSLRKRSTGCRRSVKTVNWCQHSVKRSTGIDVLRKQTTVDSLWKTVNCCWITGKTVNWGRPTVKTVSWCPTHREKCLTGVNALWKRSIDLGKFLKTANVEIVWKRSVANNAVWNGSPLSTQCKTSWQVSTRC